MLPAACPAIPSRVVQFSTPTWPPLVEVVGEELACGFMWMHEERLADGTAVHAYKHRITRRYLYVAETGETYEPTACDGLRTLRRDFAIERALLSWCMSDCWEREDQEAVRAALTRAHERLWEEA
jgi:hypothetical protein